MNLNLFETLNIQGIHLIPFADDRTLTFHDHIPLYILMCVCVYCVDGFQHPIK